METPICPDCHVATTVTAGAVVQDWRIGSPPESEMSDWVKLANMTDWQEVFITCPQCKKSARRLIGIELWRSILANRATMRYHGTFVWPEQTEP